MSLDPDPVSFTESRIPDPDPRHKSLQKVLLMVYQNRKNLKIMASQEIKKATITV